MAEDAPETGHPHQRQATLARDRPSSPSIGASISVSIRRSQLVHWHTRRLKAGSVCRHTPPAHATHAGPASHTSTRPELLSVKIDRRAENAQSKDPVHVR
ncbi:hypothetical protein LTR28_005486 [Elasticomyces elasticus]|nr:hypothetical protein LTR28_005486 [Elasticomyces elasticus]